MVKARKLIRIGNGPHDAGGDTIDVTIELDAAPRDVTVPPELGEFLAKNPAARKLFDGMSYSRSAC